GGGCGPCPRRWAIRASTGRPATTPCPIPSPDGHPAPDRGAPPIKADGPSWADLVWGEAETDLLWETFHENSKSSGYDDALPNQVVVDWMTRLKNALVYDSADAVPLPGPERFPPFTRGLGEAIARRHTPRGLVPTPMALETL